jgi:hypothetical protein
MTIPGYLRRALIAAAAVALVATGTPAHAGPPTRVTRFGNLSPLPEGATLVGKVTAPVGDLVSRSLANADATTAIRKLDPCVAKEAWARSGTALTGYMYVFNDPQTGYTEADVVWMTDDGDYEPEENEGVITFASADCATSIVMDWSIDDLSAFCDPAWFRDGLRDDEFQGPFQEPLYVIFGVGYVPYLRIDPSGAQQTCVRATSTVVFRADVSYREKNRGTKVHIACVQRTWPVVFAPHPSDDLQHPQARWLTVGPASPEETCANAT